MPLITIYNPVCGDRSAQRFVEQHVLPLLAEHGKTVNTLAPTQHAGHAGPLLVDFLESTTDTGSITVVLASGDGTLHEIINHLSLQTRTMPRFHFVLVPSGTANALYSSVFPPPADSESASDDEKVEYKLQSVRSFINSGHTIPLTLAIATLSAPPSAKTRPQVAVSSVVVSAALHASILHDSEALREEFPGIERFKIAAQKNSTKWYTSYVKLLPAPGAGRVQIYDPSVKAFVTHPDSDGDDPIVDLDGPFAYFLSTVNVDRLEPKFRITPLSRALPPDEASCEVVIVRPLRDPSVEWDTKEARESWVSKLWQIMGGAYQDGVHIDLRYDEKGKIVTGGEGPLVVEYVRCGGWEWIPDDIDESAHLLCSDGAISQIEKGGRAVCLAATPKEDAGFVVYV
ncbi:hypothetical protein DXG03_005198 [Asterophora parasitica]|uniref:DAGKc domain-containing protein n=1 Tax=Asterophora parasitica TaxID=117018 RepID=A0A9P7KFG5_9AGAR|nr:hypothetical protein DXG03_005198 [Asterophora parasitica]